MNDENTEIDLHVDCVLEPPKHIWKFLEDHGMKVSFRSTCHDFIWNGKSLGVMFHHFKEIDDNLPSKLFVMEAEYHKKNKILGNFGGYFNPETLFHEFGHWLYANEFEKRMPEYGLYIGISEFYSANGGKIGDNLINNHPKQFTPSSIKDDSQIPSEAFAFWITVLLCEKFGEEFPLDRRYYPWSYANHPSYNLDRDHYRHDLTLKMKSRAQDVIAFL